MSRLSFLKTSSLKILLGIFIFVIINLFFVFCGPYETLGGTNPGWHATCGNISWFILGFDQLFWYKGDNYSWLITLFFSYLLASLISLKLKKINKKF